MIARHSTSILLTAVLSHAACGDDGTTSASDTADTTTDDPTAAPTTAIPTTTSTTTESTDSETGTTEPITSTTIDVTTSATPGTTTLDTTSTTLDTTSTTSDTTTSDTTTSTTGETTTLDTTTTGAVDDTPPVVLLARPFDNVHLASRRLVVTGQASDDTEVVAVDLVVNGEAPVALSIVPGPVLEFSADLRLRRGWNTIEIVARDAADNSGSSVRHVHLGVPVAAGGAHSLALVNNGAWGFGRNNEGQLGVGDLVDRLVPTAALGLDDAVSLSANLNHSLAVTEAGAVVVWGRNDEGQLGQAPGADVSTPALLDLPEVVLVAAGQRHSLALTEDGQVWSFGLNNAGQLGRDGDSLPAVVPGLEDIVAIAAGGTYSLAVDGTGAVWAWGNNTDGQLGDGMTVDSPVPKAISMADAVAVAAGKAHTLAVAPLGSLAACGLNVSGQLGDGLNADNELLPVAVPEFADVLTVAASGNLSLGLAGDAALWAWGQNFSGQLGLGDTADRPAPTLVPGLPPVRAISAGLAHSVILDENGGVWAFGLNSFGQLGKGDSGNATNSAVPLLVALP
ncbi:hypothetical protein OV203_19520 [Nannocystis sp. ILAH1]|uniref:RCC1 domain-containing protein n=1 Tax=Nannocystis sp. ILAH1 TaxID=2996789 RepID=UPI002270EA0A|nr:RCC1 domain-containing protein [Nannocystis sp. ILAH1]MCY0989338.1 hypothetical protein [Nannocystis sp. ILAH1]